MVPLKLPRGPLHVLVVGAHPDDIEIGCGGALLTLAERPETRVTGIVLTGGPDRAREAAAALPRFFPGAEVQSHGLPDGRLPGHWPDVKGILEDAAGRIDPQVILAPRRDDAHQDHRLVGGLVSTVWRDCIVLEYEIPKWDGDMRPMSHYVQLSTAHARRKVELLNECFPSQRHRDWWDDEFFMGLMRMRGVECRSRYAEAFSTTKIVLDLSGASS